MTVSIRNSSDKFELNDRILCLKNDKKHKVGKIFRVTSELLEYVNIEKNFIKYKYIGK